MALGIRRATSADSVLLNELGYRIYPAHFGHLWRSESELNEYLAGEYSLSVLEQSLKSQNIGWYIAETERPLGFAKLTWQAPIPDTDMGGVLLNKLYLSPTATGHRYGEAMFAHALDLARNRGEKWLWLEVLEQNEGARRFYKKRGMEDIKDIVFETASQQSVLKIMAMRIAT